MREQDTFEPEDDPHDQTPSEDDLPDETDAERNICLYCGNICEPRFFKEHGWIPFCCVCGEP